MNHDDFMKSIVDHPDDDNRRLVYADWLEEHGDPRAEFIRIGVELHQIREHIDASMVEDFVALANRECELLYRHRDILMPDIPRVQLETHGQVAYIGPAGGGRYVFRRGFLDEVHCSLRERQQHGPELCHGNPVQHLTITGRGLDGEWHNLGPGYSSRQWRSWGRAILDGHQYGHYIPDEIFDVMVDGWETNTIVLSSEGEAWEKLHAACLKWAKQVAWARQRPVWENVRVNLRKGW